MRAQLPESCITFRDLLERSLCEPAGQRRELSWHEHLSICAGCCRLLEEEEALEYLLTTLPAPGLPEALASRVLTRLREQRASYGLDALLERDQLEEPLGLSGRIKRDLALDRLLELGDQLEVPAGLSARVLTALKGSREASQPQAISFRVLLPLAASLLALLGVFFVNREGASPPVVAELPVDESPSSEMLALLDILGDEAVWEEELWESNEAIDLALELDESDELLLEYLAATKEEQDEEENG
jgi:hypothetical protein